MNIDEDEVEPGFKTELEELSELVTARMRRNKSVEAEKKRGDAQRSSLRMTGFEPLPVQLRGYVFNIKEVSEGEEFLKRRRRDHGDLDMIAMIDRIMVTKPPETTKAMARMNKRFRNRRKAARKTSRRRIKSGKPYYPSEEKASWKKGTT